MKIQFIAKEAVELSSTADDDAPYSIVVELLFYWLDPGGSCSFSY
jgi:hypothetical protein